MRPSEVKWRTLFHLQELEIDPTYAHGYNLLGMVLFAIGEHIAAIEAFSNGRKLSWEWHLTSA